LGWAGTNAEGADDRYVTPAPAVRTAYLLAKSLVHVNLQPFVCPQALHTVLQEHLGLQLPHPPSPFSGDLEELKVKHLSNSYLIFAHVQFLILQPANKAHSIYYSQQKLVIRMWCALLEEHKESWAEVHKTMLTVSTSLHMALASGTAWETMANNSIDNIIEDVQNGLYDKRSCFNKPLTGMQGPLPSQGEVYSAGGMGGSDHEGTSANHLKSKGS
jgi:hypothetical protein